MKVWVAILFFFTINLFSYGADKYEMVVAQDRSGDFTSIQEAINATKCFPPQRITIFIKNGVYHEKVRVYNWNNDLTIIGESVENTIITYDDYFDKINMGRNSTFHTYTVKVECNDFIMENITIENTAGSVGQAVALHVEGDRCIFRNIRMTGNQDVLYAAGLNCRQYYSHCYIEGTTDFIFGAATAVFENCTIHSKSNSYITAASTPEEQAFGYVFKHCTLTADDGIDAVYLGRPWRKFAKTVFIECELGKHIIAQGWKEWSNKEDFTTTYYAEYNNIGAGSDSSQRIGWSHQMTKETAELYSLENIFNHRQQTSWTIEK